MKTLKKILIISAIIIFSYSISSAEEWYQAMERSSNDYRGSVGAMIADVDGSKYTPRYSAAALNNTRVVADARQMSQAGVSMASAARSSTQLTSAITMANLDIGNSIGPISSGSSAGGIVGGGGGAALPGKPSGGIVSSNSVSGTQVVRLGSDS